MEEDLTEGQELKIYFRLTALRRAFYGAMYVARRPKEAAAGAASVVSLPFVVVVVSVCS